ncbi:MAG: penicillin-binding protein [Armatimonadetes bacterium CG_4_10_14_0_8_um_filter_66_14]|nr:MAG: penicillin-binding protein [Armatimonadetes bacterium CG_4_10_14_0_8_um_filter_66_14]
MARTLDSGSLRILRRRTMARTHVAPPAPPSIIRMLVTLLVVTLKVLRMVIVVAVIVVVGCGIGAWVSMSKVLPDTRHLGDYRPHQTTKLYARDGELLGEIYAENREIVPLSRVPKNMRDATIAIEDERFHKHIGADPKGILRAVYANYRSHDLSQGGSTITEQLAKNIYLTRQKTVHRRLQQMLLALQIERQYSKDEILEFYLNEVCYGHNCFGVQAAAKYYFGKPVEDLTLAEAALLAGIPRMPTYYSPYDNPKAASRRRNLVLSKMVEQGLITWDEGERGKREEPQLVDPKRHRSKARFRAPYFTSYALKELVDRYGVDLVYKGGLRVTTTLSLPMAQKAYAITRKALASYRSMHVSQCALVCLDPNTGEILTLLGGRDWNDRDAGEFNRATQAHRQPGSSFKPYVYATALESGYGPNSAIVDGPVSYPDGDKIWRPRNYDGRFRGTVTLRTALAWSINIPAVKLNVAVGPKKVVAYAHRLGIHSELAAVKSLALGSAVVTLLEHTSAYGTFAAGGIRAEPTTILAVRDANGITLDQHVPQRSVVLKSNTAAMITDMLIYAVEHGTGGRAKIPGVKVAGKTGTTSESRDVWFMGYTPNLVTGVWCGNDDNSPMRGRGVAGGTLCGPIWKEFTEFATKRYGGKGKFVEVDIQAVKAPPVDESKATETEGQPAWVEICMESGMRAGPGCPSVQRRELPPGAAIPAACTVHGSSAGAANRGAPEGGGERGSTDEDRPSAETVTVTVCTQSGRIATPYCPLTKVVTIRADLAPRATCGMHAGSSGATTTRPSPQLSPPAPSPTTAPLTSPIAPAAPKPKPPAAARDEGSPAVATPGAANRPE